MWTISNARNRKGFTLIELMIVIAIIIILAAIAIPNYLKMTQRAKKARVASDFETLATALEAYRTDWGAYPTDGSGSATSGTPVNDSTKFFYEELTGTNATVNKSGNTTATGEDGGIEYIKAATLQSMNNPFYPTETYYYATGATGQHWLLSAHIPTDKNNNVSVYRTDSTTQLTYSTTAANSLTIDDSGNVGP